MEPTIEDPPVTAPAPSTDRHRSPDRMSLARWTAATLSAVAGGVHLGYAPHHLSEDWAHGWFFLVLGTAQIAAALLLVARCRRWVWASIVAIDLATLAIWIVSRTAGLPFGPTALRHEGVGVPDLVCAILESVVVVVAIAVLVRPAPFDRPVRHPRIASSLVAVFVAVTIISGAVVLTPTYTEAHGAEHSHASASTGDTPCELAGPPASSGQVSTDGEGHSHRGPSPQSTLSNDERIALEAQQTEARAAAARYPTVASAEAAGYRMSVSYVPCIGAHYTNPIYAVSFDPAHPSELLYDGTTPESRIVGLSYLVWHHGGPPEGFAGPNDAWHQHNANGGLCQRRGVVIGAESMGEEECTAKGGRKVALDDVWMLHDWVVPGWECSWGVFAGECPELGGRTGGSAWDAPAPDSLAALTGRSTN